MLHMPAVPRHAAGPAAALALCLLAVPAGAVTFSHVYVNDTGVNAHDFHVELEPGTYYVKATRGPFDGLYHVNGVAGSSIDWSMGSGANNGGQAFIAPGQTIRLRMILDHYSGKTPAIHRAYWTDEDHDEIAGATPVATPLPPSLGMLLLALGGLAARCRRPA